jgi:hypothetical protein
MLTFTDDEFKRAIQDETGIKPSWAAESFGDLEEEVRQSMRRIEASPFLTKHESMRGFIFDVATGKLNKVTLSTPQVGRGSSWNSSGRLRRRSGHHTGASPLATHRHLASEPCGYPGCGCTIFERMPDLSAWPWPNSPFASGAGADTSKPYPLDM